MVFFLCCTRAKKESNYVRVINIASHCASPRRDSRWIKILCTTTTTMIVAYITSFVTYTTTLVV